MKIFTALTLLMIVPITVACADSDSKSVTQKMLKPLIEQQCATELKNSKVWQTSSLFWSTTQQSNAQHKICGCVSENALNNVGTKELWVASVNESAKNKLIEKAVVNSLKGCAAEIFK
ncbi:hypothetical protein ACDW34_06170 [Acinetobacter piscicola]|uniref:hypothetical protein n=1 Tax=Acinetobacter piscicola TaxID=2006115 RepID=UPI0035565FDD